MTLKTYPESIMDSTQSLETRTHKAFLHFRYEVQDRMQQLLRDGGAEALKYVLNESETSARDAAILLKAEQAGFEYGLSRLDGDWRCHKSPEDFYASAIKTTESSIKFYKEESEDYALSIISTDPSDEKYLNGRKLALRAHQQVKAHEKLLAMFKDVFKPLEAELTRPAADSKQ